jgi:hypothetical protein
MLDTPSLGITLVAAVIPFAKPRAFDSGCNIPWLAIHNLIFGSGDPPFDSFVEVYQGSHGKFAVCATNPTLTFFRVSSWESNSAR